jgi:hypothetical protein
MGDLSAREAIPAELSALRRIAENSPATGVCPMPSVCVLLRHIAWQEQEIARLRRLVESRPRVVVPLRSGSAAMAGTALQGREPVPLPIAPQPGIAASRHDPDAQHEPHGPCGDRACAHGCWTWRSFGRRCGAAKEAGE